MLELIFLNRELTKREWRYADVIEEEVDEDESNDGSANRFGVCALKVDCRQCRENGVGDQHADARGQPQRSTSNFVNAHGSEDGSEEVEDLQDAVDQSLVETVRDANRIENKGKVVCDDSVARPLLNESSEDCNEEALLVASCLPQLRHSLVGQNENMTGTGSDIQWTTTFL